MHSLCDPNFFEFSEKRNSIFILIFNKAAAINYFEHLFRSTLTCTQCNEFIYTPLLSSLMHTIVIILLNAYTIYFLLNWYSTNFLVYSWPSIFFSEVCIKCITCMFLSNFLFLNFLYLLETAKLISNIKRFNANYSDVKSVLSR